jgi:hypothetical protein
MLIWGFTAALLDWLLRMGGWERPWDAARTIELPFDQRPAGWPVTGS